MELTDIVFEDRNKEYGAYYLRKRYLRVLLFSFSITILLCVLLVGYVWLREYMDTSYMPSIKGVVFAPTVLPEEIMTSTPPEEQKPEDVLDVKDEPEVAPVVSDSVQEKVAKPKAEPQKEETAAADSSSGGGNMGDANGELTIAIERMPQFPGGDKALNAYMLKNIRYNQLAKNTKIRGLVIISFVVRRDGSLNNIKMVKSLSAEFDQECIRVVSSMPRWSPALNSGGKPIDLTLNLPFMFSF